MKSLDELIQKLTTFKMPIEIFKDNLTKVKTTFESPDLQIELMIANGLPIQIDEDFAYLKTLQTKIEDQIFCIVDIETNGNTPKNGQIIEIGAIKFKNGKILDTYESFAFTAFIPDYITVVTNINVQMTQSSPPIQTVLEEFKIFLDDAIFVAHNVNFDYKFISQSLELYNLGELLNRKLCTIDLAKRLIVSEKYGLESLKEILGIHHTHHRALSDAYSSMEILKYCLNILPPNVQTSEELIKFSKSTTKQKQNG